MTSATSRESEERISVPLSPHAVAPDLGSWRAEAACQFGDHELFFLPEEEQGEYFRLRVSAYGLAYRVGYDLACRRLRREIMP